MKCTLRDLRGPQTLTKLEFSLLQRKEGRSSRSFLMLLLVRAGHVPAGTAPQCRFPLCPLCPFNGHGGAGRGQIQRVFRVLKTGRSWPTTWLCTFQNVQRNMRTGTSPVIPHHVLRMPFLALHVCVHHGSASKSTEPCPTHHTTVTKLSSTHAHSLEIQAAAETTPSATNFRSLNTTSCSIIAWMGTSNARFSVNF